MKVYEAPTLLDAMSSRRHEYETLRDQLITLKHSFQAIVDLDDEFQGKGADAIKGFYGAQIDVVEVWIQLAERNIAFFDGIHGDADDRNLGRELVELPFLEGDLRQSERRSDEMVAAQQQELQGILNRISDIHPLNVFSRDQFDAHMEDARRKREETLDAVNQFDEELKREYLHLETSEQVLTGLMKELMESSTQDSHISPLYFNAAAYYSSDAYQLTDDITAETESYLKFKEAQEQAREPKPLPEEEVNENPFMESLNSFKEIGQDLWAGLEKRNEEKFDSVYDFGNYITAGGLDLGKGFMSGLNERAEVATESGSDFINYLTMGGVDLFNGAVNPEDTYSKEHWMNSFGLAALLVGGAKPGLKVKGGTNIPTPAPRTVPKVSLTHRWDQIRLGIDDFYNRPMVVADNGMLVGGEPGWSRFSVERTVKENKVSTGDRVGAKGMAEAANLWRKSTCTNDELYNYLLKNVDINVANKFLKEGKWPAGIQIPKNSSVLHPEGSINWSKAAEGGYTLNVDGTAIKEQFTPEMREVIDRYGNPNGRYTSPVINGESYLYTERSLPYVEDLSNYHQYEIKGDFNKIKDYVDKCPDKKLKTEIEATVRKYYKGDYSRLVSYKGNAAAVEGWGKGGAVQYEFSLTVGQLERLGLLKEIK
ncbi:T7SS effector LXG polymorphic toxin [Rossellomorea sp. DA94]|uniref:T7SS effector LXG polymorphic toxin n=1 Tax=Rossellomorea sp. DA94 TaxID=3038653 RepID=UPI002446FDD5|nr:T7SS effector LXG polymorphic toxin [Rossellomorea sp. DA94]WGG46431.1 T7SS effector LXG polymorphic toxin [Rossellomorea sp. DA94]